MKELKTRARAVLSAYHLESMERILDSAIECNGSVAKNTIKSTEDYISALEQNNLNILAKRNTVNFAPAHVR
ncbi:MAG: hypothetical protein FWG39_03210 [Alphaproteobacteria bacterium]|nr:hypothetical protein [Alphaproteobacteria bacterium]